VNREIGRIVSPNPGATLVVVAGIHGNEQAGIHAARRVLDRLQKGDIAWCGEVVALKGNVAGIEQKRRYLAKDLNRVWSDADVAALEARETDSSVAEDKEQRELLTAIRAAAARARGKVVLIDLHSTSASGVPFVACGTSMAEKTFVADLPIPIIIGLAEKVEGALSAYWNAHGLTAFTVEGGQHDDPATIDNLEAALLVTLEIAGMVPMDTLPEMRAALRLLDSRRGDLPRMMEVVSRFAITPEQGFTMMPGFRNLDYAKGAQLLARDKNGEIRADSDGVVILPLYQGQGNDGFFWGRPIESPSQRQLPPDSD
jgi:succinylglutamate desuccinylase